MRRGRRRVVARRCTRWRRSSRCVTRSVARRASLSTASAVETRKPHQLVIFPRQYPALVRDTAWLHRMTRVATRYLKHFSFLWRLHKDVAAFHVAPGASVRLPKPRRAVTPAPWWGAEEDRDCLLGTVRHGWGSWRAICEDVELCFHAKGVVYMARAGEEEEMEEEGHEGVEGVRAEDIHPTEDTHTTIPSEDTHIIPSEDIHTTIPSEDTHTHIPSEDTHTIPSEDTHIIPSEDIHTIPSENPHTTDTPHTNTKLFPSPQLLMKRIRRLVDAMESALEKGLQTASLDYAPRPTSPKKPKKSTLPFRGAWQVKEAKALRNAILRWGLPLPPLFPAERARLLASDRTGFPAPALAEERELAAICDVVDSLVRDVQASFPSIPQPAQLLNPVTLSARDTAAPFPFHACPACVCRSAREGYCPFCDLYVGYRVLKVESSLLYKSYYDIQDLARFLESQTRSICDQPSRPRGKKSSEEEPPSDPPKIPAEVEAILPSLVLAQRLHSRLQLFYELQQLAWPRDRALLAALLQRWAAGASHPQETTSRGWRPEVHDLALLEGVYRWGVAEWDLLWRDPALPFFVDPLGERRKPHRRRRKGGKAKEGKGGKSKEEKEKYENDGKGGNIEEDGKGGKKDEEGNEEPVDETLEEETTVRSEKPPYTLEDAIRLKSPRVDRSQLVGFPAGVEGR